MLLHDNLHERTETLLNNKQPTQSELKHFGLKKKLSLQSAQNQPCKINYLTVTSETVL